MDLDWTGYYIPLEKDSSMPNMDEINWYNEEMREPFAHVVEAIRKHSYVREPLAKWQINQIVKNNDFDNFYDFVKLIEKAHGIIERNEDAN
jgi:hypothetical protein